MHAVQSALAIKRERERRQSLKGQRPNSRKPSTDSTLPPMAPSDFRPLPESNGTFTYTTVGISFIIFGSLMLVPIFAGGHEFVGLDWHHLLGIGGLLIAIGVLMIVVKLLTDEDTDIKEKMDKYKPKMGRSDSKNPIMEDVEYGMDSRRNSVTKPPMEPNPEPSPPTKPKKGVDRV